MAVALTSGNFPAPNYPSTQYLLATAENTTGTGVPTARVGASGGFVDSSKWNRNACEIDVGLAFGGNGYGIINGLGLSVSSGLSIAVAAGQAAMYGVIEPLATTFTAPDNTARVFAWLKMDGTLTTTTTTTAPSADSVYLGSFVTSGGVVTGPTFDTSGVCYVRGGMLWRDSADLLAPTDSPNAAVRVITNTLFGRFLWNGTEHALIRSWHPEMDAASLIYAFQAFGGF